MSCLSVIVLLVFANYATSSENTCVCPTSDDDLSNLQSLHIIMRHGIRAPYTTYPLDPNANDTTRFPNGKSQLTDKGIEQVYNVGKFYKQRYGNFLKDKQKQAFLRSSAAQRCIDSIAIVAKTLWPPQDDNSKWWQPMIFSLPKQIDGILYEEPDCHPADDEEQNNLKTPEVEAYEKDPKIQALYRYVADNTGLGADMYNVTKAFDCVRCEKLNGLSSPAWATPEKYEEMGDVLSKRLNFFYTSKKAQRLRAGPILNDFKNNMNAVANAKPGDNQKKVFLYGSHDFKIAALLSAIGEPQPKYPPFAGAVIFELHKIGGQNIVRALYLNQTVNLPYTATKLKLPNCVNAGTGPKIELPKLPHLPKLTEVPKLLKSKLSELPKLTDLPIIPKITADTECTLENFEKSIADMAPVDWKTECAIDCSYDPFKVAENNIGST